MTLICFLQFISWDCFVPWLLRRTFDSATAKRRVLYWASYKFMVIRWNSTPKEPVSPDLVNWFWWIYRQRSYPRPLPSHESGLSLSFYTVIRRSSIPYSLQIALKQLRKLCKVACKLDGAATCWLMWKLRKFSWSFVKDLMWVLRKSCWKRHLPHTWRSIKKKFSKSVVKWPLALFWATDGGGFREYFLEFRHSWFRS